jgi:hypothetical protein
MSQYAHWPLCIPTCGLVLSTLFTVRMLPLQWSSAFFWMVASTKPRGVGTQKAARYVIFSVLLFLLALKSINSSLWSNSSVLRLWVVASWHRAVLYVDTKLSTETLPLFRLCRWNQHVVMHLPDSCAIWQLMSLLPVASLTQIYVFTSAEIHYRVHKNPSLIAIPHQADLVHALPSSLRYILF